jgi:hypothetical protein
MASSGSLCSFAGYVTEARTRIIQEWYDALPDEERDEVQDTLNYLGETPITDWRRPEFDKVRDPLREIRCKANKKNHEIRIYGVFDSSIRGRFIMLHATEAKKKSNDTAGQDLAIKRLSLISQRKASTHEFVI